MFLLDELDWFNHPMTSFFYAFFLIVSSVVIVGMILGCLLLGILTLLDKILPTRIKGE